MAEYYISKNGNNTNPGTKENPWKDIEFAEKQICKGDKIRE